MSVCGGIGGRGLEHLPGVCGGLLHSCTDSRLNEGTTWSSSTGLWVEGSVLQDKTRWEGRDFFGGNLCVLGLCFFPVREGNDRHIAGTVLHVCDLLQFTLQLQVHWIRYKHFLDFWNITCSLCTVL